MKLLFAIKRLDSAVGGAERVLCSVCSELVERGHEVSILTFDHPGGRPFYPLDKRVKRIDLGIGDSSRQAKVGETLLRMRVLRRIVPAECPDVVVGFMHSMFVPLAFALIGTNIPVLGSEHTVPEYYHTCPFQYFLLMTAAPFITKLTVLSETIRLQYPAIVRQRMVVMPNPVKMASSVVDVGSTKESFVLLCVGRLDEFKDQVTLLRAFAQIARRFPLWHLKIIGEGPLRLKLERLIDSLNLKKRVTMPGVTTTIDKEYQMAEVFVISSRYEAFGLVTAEAMSHGLPVVGFVDCPGTNELIDDGKTGLLVAPGSDRALSLASALSSLLADPALRRNLGNTARQFIDKRFSSQQVCDKWEQLLQSLSRKASSPFVSGGRS